MSDLFDKYGHPIRVLINPDCPQDLFDKSGRPHIVVENADGIDLSTSEFLAALLKGSNLLHIPTNAGWTEVVAGTGGTGQEISRLAVTTGADAGSAARLYSLLFGFRLGSFYERLDWDKKLYLVFNYCRTYNPVAEGIGRFQIKEVTTEGALAAKGLGLRIDDLSLKGESFGTSLGVVNLGVTLVMERGVQIVIIHYPASKIEWYVNIGDGNGLVLRGTQSTLDNIPSGQAGTTSKMVHSAINGGTAAIFYASLLHPKIWQEV